ncbi:MAG: hypothetical protein M1831_004993 [Alyxoria varia]|nr:MAG: hypothetical protein M1831_004993 [Alyxoria varia]
MEEEEEAPNATVLILNLPPSAFCGINLLSFTTNPHFHGINHLPPGWHFVFTGVTNSFSLRYGAWFRVSGASNVAPELFITKWISETETLEPQTETQEVLRWRANLGSLWREGLTPYRQSASGTPGEEDPVSEEKQDWTRMTDCVSPEILTRICGSAKASYWTLDSASSAPQDFDHIPGLTEQETHVFKEQKLGFLPIDLKQTWREGAVGRERTEAAQDRSWALQNLLESRCMKATEIIGELQFCFLMVLTLNNNSCLEQWKRILGVVLTCSKIVIERPLFFIQFLSCLRLQLEHCKDVDGGLFDLSDENNSILQINLKRFRKGLEKFSGEAKSDVMDELDELEDFMKDEYGWSGKESYVKSGMIDLEDGERVEMDMNGMDEDDETGDYAPTVVELSPEQRKELGLNGVNGVRPDTQINGTTDVEHEAMYQEMDHDDDQDIEEMDTRF